MSNIIWRKDGKNYTEFVPGASAHYVYRNLDGKPKWKSLKTQNVQIAAQLKDKYDDEIEQKGEITERKAATWDSYFEEYKKIYAPGRAQNTMKRLAGAGEWFKKLMNPGVLTAISASMLRSFQGKLLSHMKPSSANTVMNYVGPVFAAAHADGVIPTNPYFNIERLRFAKSEPKWFTYEQAEAIICEALKDPNPIYYPMMVYLDDTGKRLDEMLHQLIENVNFEDGYLKIANHPDTCKCYQCDHAKKPGWHTKNYHERYVPLTPRLRAILLEIRKERKTGCIFHCTPKVVQHGLDRFLKKVGLGNWQGKKKLDKYSPHTFRRTLAGDMRRSGMDEIIWDGDILGHSKSSMARLYDHTLLAEIIREFQKLIKYREGLASEGAVKFKVI